MKFIYSTGGREKYFKGETGDCVTRAIANATGMDYKEVYDAINKFAKTYEKRKRNGKRSSARSGVYIKTERAFLASLGWRWYPTMSIGSGCKVHLDENELPSGTLIVSVSGHATCVKDGVLYDTYDCTRDGSRCVYGYYKKDANASKRKAIEERIKSLNAEADKLGNQVVKLYREIGKLKGELAKL